VNNANDDIHAAIELDGDLPVLPPEIKLLADLLPDLIKDLLAMQDDAS